MTMLLKPRMRAAYDALLDYNARRRAARTLCALDDFMLKDMGIGRSEIHARVHGLSCDLRVRRRGALPALFIMPG